MSTLRQRALLGAACFVIAIVAVAEDLPGHSWTDTEVGDNGTTTIDGVTAKKQGGQGTVTIRKCTSPDHNHHTVIFAGGASGSVSGLDGTSTNGGGNDHVEITGDGGNVRVDGNGLKDGTEPTSNANKGIDITGSNNTVTVTGDGNSVDCTNGAQGNSIKLGTTNPNATSANFSNVNLHGTTSTCMNVNGTNNLSYSDPNH